MTTLPEETTSGTQNIIDVLRRWWLLLAIGTLLAMGAGAAASVASPSQFAADSRVLVNQPAQTLEPGDDAAVQRLSALMETLAEVSTSDTALGGVAKAIHSERTVSDLRDRVSVEVVAGTLILDIRATFPTADEAEKVSAALIAQIEAHIGALSDASKNPVAHLSVLTIQAPTVSQQGGGIAQALVISFILGFGFSVMAAFALDRG